MLTNNHVVAGADEVIVRLPDNRRFTARVLGSDPPTDVAVVRIDKPPADLQTVTLGDSDRVRVGDYVLAIGNPLGLGQTVTMGIVSAKNRVIGEKLGDIDPRYEDFIQTDAAINQGNSGGPLFNFRGEVIGINSAIINPGIAMNVGFAIPINLARQIADQIRKSGRVARGFLGVSGEDFTAERAAEMHVPFVPGALINAVGRGTPAAAAGLRPNDVVIECAGKPIDGYRRLVAVDRAAPAGREGEAGAVAPGAARRDGRDAGRVRAGAGGDTVLGVELRPLDPRESAALGLGAGEGLAVTAVDPRGPASGVLEEGDVLLALDNRGDHAGAPEGGRRAPAARRARDAGDSARAGPVRAAPVDSSGLSGATTFAKGFARCRRSRHRARCRARARWLLEARARCARDRSTAGRRWRASATAGWLAPLRRPSTTMARVARRRLRVLASLPAGVRGVHGAARRRRPGAPARPLRGAARPRRLARRGAPRSATTRPTAAC